nr:TetR family transcriptional regulator [Propionicicella superfundia]
MTGSDSRPRRRLDPDVRRAAILDAAAAEFAAHPYEDVGVAGVAVAAEASEALVYRYFDSKAGLYAAVVERSLAILDEEQSAALARLGPRTPRRERVRAQLEVLLDTVAAQPTIWAAPLAGGNDPAPAVVVRRDARGRAVERLTALLQAGEWLRQEYAMWGFQGFIDQACLRWVERGCRDEERPHVLQSMLGALEGALGDWGG